MKPHHCDCPFGDVEFYFIWKVKGRSFIRKFDYCSGSNTISLKSNPDELFEFYALHKATWEKERAYWKAYVANNKKGKTKFLPAGPSHFSFDDLYFNKYQFSLPDYYFNGDTWNFLPWKDTQKSWIKLIGDFLSESHFKWKLE